MKNTRSLAVVSEESLITKIIRSLKNFLNIKKESKEENTNRRATVIKTEKIERRASKNITLNDLNNLENNISKNIDYINELDEDEGMEDMQMGQEIDLTKKNTVEKKKCCDN